MSEIFRDSTVGQILRYVTGGRVLKYIEEQPDFILPREYRKVEINQTASFNTLTEDTPAADLQARLKEKDGEKQLEAEAQPTNLATFLEGRDIERYIDAEVSWYSDSESVISSHTAGRVYSQNVSTGALVKGSVDGVDHVPPIEEVRLEAKLERALSKVGSVAIAPDKLGDGTILVDWYTSDDPENPQNWSQKKKAFVIGIICMYTFAVYIGSAIYTSSEFGVMEEFGVSGTRASLGLSLYVLGYGIGPLLFSPLSEIPAFGRNLPYIPTFAIFTILCVPTALVHNFAGLLVLRFLQGFFGSPALATGGASIQDVYSLIKLPYALAFWLASAYGGPALGPVVASFAVTAENWRWSLWEMLWIAGPVCIVMFLYLPETSSDTILLKRARRLRARTGNANLKSQSEIDQGNMSFGSVVKESLLVPMKIAVLDPAVLFANAYTCLCYGIYYSFFEAFPLVYMDIYGFTPNQMGLVFLSIIVACILGISSYSLYLWFVLEPKIRKFGMGPQEERLIPALYAAFLAPIGLFLFAWSARTEVHWIVSAMGITIYTWGVYLIVQCVFVYIPLTYPSKYPFRFERTLADDTLFASEYAASLFAGNDMCRSSLAAGSILFGTPLFKNLGMGPGVSLLAGLMVVCIGGNFYLYFKGAGLRAKSKFAIK